MDIDSLTINTTEPAARFPYSRTHGGQASWASSALFHSGRYAGRTQPIEIDPELNRLVLAEAAQPYPEFAGQALRVTARPLLRGFAWQLEWKGTPPTGQPAWEFQNAAI